MPIALSVWSSARGTISQSRPIANDTDVVDGHPERGTRLAQQLDTRRIADAIDRQQGSAIAPVPERERADDHYGDDGRDERLRATSHALLVSVAPDIAGAAATVS